MRVLLAALLGLALSAFPAAAVEIRGAARVVDGDTLQIGAETVRLHGIDAPEGAQSCGRRACGAEAAAALSRLIAHRPVTCRGSDRDRYDRLIAVCEADGAEINARMVADGLARAFLSYSDDYAAEERAARRAGAGFWAGEFPAPWEFRRESWQTAAASSPAGGCPIKGNISAGGRIYHTPYSRWYDRTRIDPARGERWFCSEREALEAGWRPARGG